MLFTATAQTDNRTILAAMVYRAPSWRVASIVARPLLGVPGCTGYGIIVHPSFSVTTECDTCDGVSDVLNLPPCDRCHGSGKLVFEPKKQS